MDIFERIGDKMKPKTTKFVDLGYSDEWFGYIFRCVECGATGLLWDDMNYCPHCGREVEV